MDNINILELSSLGNNEKLSCGVNVKKINPALSYSILYLNKNSNKKTLVLDLDETLVHSSTESPFPNRKNIVLNLKIKNLDYKIYAIVRPYLDFFLKEMSYYYNLYIFTASMSQYSKALLDIIDKNKLIIKTFSREYCQYKFGIYFKDLSIFNVDYKDIIIIDNNPASYALNKSNGIPIQTWIDDPNDNELIKLIPLLKYLANVDDVRPIIKKIVNNSNINLSSFNSLLNNNNKQNLKINNEMSLNSKIYQASTETLHKKSKPKLKLNNKAYINLSSTNSNNNNNNNLTKNADGNKENKKEIKIKNYVNTKKISSIKENNINNSKINKAYIFKKKISKKLIKEKIPQDKIKQKEVKNQPDIYNISIGNITNIQNNIKIILKNKNRIIIAKRNKPEKISIKKLKTKSDNLFVNNINKKIIEKNNSEEVLEKKYISVKNINNMNISEENKHQTKNEIIYKSSTFKKMFEKMPLDKDEYPKKIPNDIKIFYFPTNDKIKNTILKENQGKDNIVFNKSYELNNYLKLNNTHQQTLKKKFVVMNMIKNKIESDRNNTLKRKVNTELKYRNDLKFPKNIMIFYK